MPVGRDELGEVRQQLAGQVVDDGVAEVLEQLRGRGLPAARQAAQDDDGRFGLGGVGRGGSSVRPGPVGHLPERRMKTTVNSNRMYIVPPSTIGLTRSPPGVATAAKIGDAEDDHPARLAQLGRGHDPDPRQPVEQDRELHDQAEHEEHRRDEVEVRPGGEVGDQDVVREREQERQGERQDDVGDRDAEREEEQGERDPRAERSCVPSRSGPARRTPTPDRAGPAWRG